MNIKQQVPESKVLEFLVIGATKLVNISVTKHIDHITLGGSDYMSSIIMNTAIHNPSYCYPVTFIGLQLVLPDNIYTIYGTGKTNLFFISIYHANRYIHTIINRIRDRKS